MIVRTATHREAGIATMRNRGAHAGLLVPVPQIDDPEDLARFLAYLGVGLLGVFVVSRAMAKGRR